VVGVPQQIVANDSYFKMKMPCAAFTPFQNENASGSNVAQDKILKCIQQVT
jgi:hypothetical protein